ncbi:hypothetical protein [Rhodococcus tibetensis]|uniref:Uncharacterized protein n=1 Tax=Rhodococcus tibetensis TaxID=2965064 RepID=A0ABT1QK52_9NOCA|nr:hypothetical protein [Rhodococcus sp. FXJ9.536]MCQ4122674.1 hypothetical protein [Rhodococcus sp. FXJ9.536]
MSSVTTSLARITRHPATRAVARCAVMCAASAIGRRVDGPHPAPDTPGGHNRGCSA